jgi:hypothetical protein
VRCHPADHDAGRLAPDTNADEPCVIDESGRHLRLLFWSWVWGIWGMLLAVPMMMAIKVVCDHVEPLQPVAHLLSE